MMVLISIYSILGMDRACKLRNVESAKILLQGILQDFAKISTPMVEVSQDKSGYV